MSYDEYDAVVVGSGPNGLSAAIALARAGLSVAVFEGAKTIGGGMRSLPLTLPGFIHDVCSAIHPLALGSPFFSKLPLGSFGLEWIQPKIPLAHPFEDGTAALLERSIEATTETLDEKDRSAYHTQMASLVRDWELIEEELLGPFRIPRHPMAMMHFALKGIRSATSAATKNFKGKRAQGLFAGLAAHSIQPLEQPLTAAFGFLLAVLGHKFGWPLPKGGSQKIADALGGYFLSLGGRIFTGFTVRSLEELPPSSLIMLDLTPQQVLKLGPSRFPQKYVNKLEKFRYGPGVFKIDWALDAPIPWRAHACRSAGTVHLGNTMEEIAKGEREVWQGTHPEKPYVLLAQQSLFDSTRAPPGKQAVWAYCHVPHGSKKDMTLEIENQIERFAPGFKERILATCTRTASDFERYNPNCIGGDITGGVQDIWQLFTRPAGLFAPYATPDPRIYFCSSSTPPGGGVHGMCGLHAARLALYRLFGLKFDSG